MDEQKQAEASENPDQLGPYQLQEQVPQAARGQEELYLATHETSGATALVLKLNAEQDAAALKDWRVSLISSSAPSAYVAMEVEQTPWSRAPDRQSVESLVFTFEGVRKAVQRMARAVPENYESPPLWRLKLGVASAAAVCALLLALICLLSVFRSPNGPEPLTSAPTALGAQDKQPTAYDGVEGANVPLNAATLVQTEEPNSSGITYPLPTKPFGNQAKAPCKPRKGEVEINGGCWVELAKRPPCYDDQAEYQGKCYLPVAERPKPQPSAIQP
jgi:anti-sigma-K factor RskA